MSLEGQAPRPLLSPVIEYGHILQFIGMIVGALFITVGIYLGVISHLAEHDTQIANHTQRLIADEDLIKRVETTQQVNALETRAQLTKLIESVADLRVRVEGAITRGQDAQRH